jgi:hypothetical protein
MTAASSTSVLLAGSIAVLFLWGRSIERRLTIRPSNSRPAGVSQLCSRCGGVSFPCPACGRLTHSGGESTPIEHRPVWSRRAEASLIPLLRRAHRLDT